MWTVPLAVLAFVTTTRRVLLAWVECPQVTIFSSGEARFLSYRRRLHREEESRFRIEDPPWAVPGDRELSDEAFEQVHSNRRVRLAIGQSPVMKYMSSAICKHTYASLSKLLHGTAAVRRDGPQRTDDNGLVLVLYTSYRNIAGDRQAGASCSGGHIHFIIIISLRYESVTLGVRVDRRVVTFVLYRA